MSGSVTFYDGGTSIGTVPVASGNPTSAAHTTSSLALGSDTITATYSGDANFATATSGGTSVNVVPATTAISLDATPNPGQAVYVADTGNNEVVRVAPDGTQTVVLSGLNAPRGVSVDAAGDVYVADTGNNRVVEVPLGGSERTVVSGLKQPQAVAVDNSGDVYVADTGNNRVIEVTPDNTQEVIASGLSDPDRGRRRPPRRRLHRRPGRQPGGARHPGRAPRFDHTGVGWPDARLAQLGGGRLQRHPRRDHRIVERGLCRGAHDRPVRRRPLHVRARLQRRRRGRRRRRQGLRRRHGHSRLPVPNRTEGCSRPPNPTGPSASSTTPASSGAAS